MRGKILALTAIVAIGALMLTGCTSDYQSQVVADSSVAVASDSLATSYNANTTYGRTEASRDVAYATGSGFNYYKPDATLVRDESFGTYEKLSDDPLVVKYTIADGVSWSDGNSVGASDLLLQWAAMSGALNDRDVAASDFIDPATGQFTDDYPSGAVSFDAGPRSRQPTGLALVSQTPVVSDDQKSITMTWDRPFADWELSFWSLGQAGLPAHVVAREALGIDDGQRANTAVINAIRQDDRAVLAKLSRFWDTGFTLNPKAVARDLLVSSGPYVVSDVILGHSVTLAANPRYSGARQPKVETITLNTVANPLAAIQALNTGEVQVISPPPSADVVSTLATLNQNVVTAPSAAFEHLDLQVTGSVNGVFDDQRVREAFLKTVPRQAIAGQALGAVIPDPTTRDSFLFTPGTEGYDAAVRSNGSRDYLQPDIDSAIALLGDAGVTSPGVCILYDPANANRVAQFALIAQSAALAGFTVTDCSRPDWRSVLGAVGEYDAALFAWSPATASPAAAAGRATTDDASNLNGFSDAGFDALVSRVQAEPGVIDRQKLLAEADGLLWQQAYGLPLYQLPVITAFDSAAVSAIAPSAFPPGVFWNVWDWSAISR